MKFLVLLEVVSSQLATNKLILVDRQLNMDTKKKIYVNCFVNGVFEDSLGSVCEDDTAIVSFVTDVFYTYNYKELLISTIVCYVYRSDKQELVRVSNTSFIENESDLYVCSSKDKEALLKAVKKKSEKKAKREAKFKQHDVIVVKDEDGEESDDNNSSVKKETSIVKKPYRNKTTSDRLHDHWRQMKSGDPNYSK